MDRFRSGRIIALAQALITSLIWASSFVFVKILLPEVGPLTIAGLRYFLAFIILLPFMLKKTDLIRNISPKQWGLFTLIGLSAYTIGNGAFFWGLKYLSSTTTSFLLGTTPLLILVASIFFLKEIPSRLQVVGLVISLIGNGVFFSAGLNPGEPLGIAIMAIGVLAYSAFGVLSRGAARTKRIDTILLTGLPLGIGGGILLLVAIPLEGWPSLTPTSIFIVFWLAVVNTAIAYVLYNRALQTITAVEMNVMLNLAPLGTAALAWLLLGEQLASHQLFGVVIVIFGVTLVQIKRNEQ